jgi:hypothetical protein
MTRAEMAAAIEAAHLRGGPRSGGTSPTGTPSSWPWSWGSTSSITADGMDRECIEKIVEAGTFVVPSMFFVFRLWEMVKGRQPDHGPDHA